MSEFKVKTLENIVKGMIEWTQGNTTKIKDFSVGSKIRTLYEAVAIEIEELYYKVWQGLKNTIEEGIYVLYNFNLLPALRATGTVIFSRSTPASQDFTIPVGTIVSTERTSFSDVIQFETIETVVLPQGETQVSVTVRALKEGKIGNVQSGTITQFVTKPGGIESVYNPYKIVNGRELETRDERKRRFKDYIASLHKGTKAALKYCAKYVANGIHEANVVDNPDLKVFVWDYSEDSYEDISFDANYPYSSIFPFLLPSSLSIGDCLYIGCETDKFNMLFMNLNSFGAGFGGDWEYWNGTTWTKIQNLIDNTNNFTQNGSINFITPLNWKDLRINEIWGFWIRYNVKSMTSATSPQINFVFGSPPPGFVDIYIQDIDGDASSELIDEVISKLPDFRGAGITVNVRMPIKILLPIICHIRVNRLFEIEALMQKTKDLIIAYLNEFVLGQHLYLSNLINNITSIDGGDAIITAEIIDPSKDILVSSGEILRPDEDNIEIIVVN